MAKKKKKKDVKFLGYGLPRGSTVGSPDGDIGVEQFIKAYNEWSKSGCALCGDKQTTVYAFGCKIVGADGHIGICEKCLGRLNRRDLSIEFIGSNLSPPVIRAVDKIIIGGWITEADIVLGDLSESALEYRRKLKVWLDPKLEPERELNRERGIYYVVEIAGYEFKFEHYKDVLRFSHVRDRFYCDIEYFLETLENGEVWVEGDVSVWVVHEVNE